MYLNPNTEKAIEIAKGKAKEYAHALYGGSHLLWSILHDDVGLVSLLENTNKSKHQLRDWANFRIENYPKSSNIPNTILPDDKVNLVFKEAERLRLKRFDEDISPLHILEALLQAEIVFTAQQLKSFPIGLSELDSLYNKQGTHSTIASAIDKSSNETKKKSNDALSKYCDDLTIKARAGKIDSIIGRGKEMKQLVEILGKRISPNVLIIGEPGVGKTAIVGGLALDILANNVPNRLKDASVFELDLNGRLIAGAYKGEVEARLKEVLEAIKTFGGKAILFIDEIHILLDEAGSIGAGVVNLLKPELARGELLVIGATTKTEYRKFIESDAAFNRRFSILNVEEPDESTTIEMIKGLLQKFEEHHQLTVNQDSISDLVRLAKRYNSDKFLPAAAIEILDVTMSSMRVMNDTSLHILDVINMEIEAAQSDESDILLKNIVTDFPNRISHLLAFLIEGENISVNKNEYKKWLSASINLIKKELDLKKSTIEKEHVMATIAHRSGIPMGKIANQEQQQLQQLEVLLSKKVVGQDKAVFEVAQALRRSRAGLKEAKKPAAVFFFLGPTGTGKTELTKTIASILFNDPEALIRFDMSELKEEHSAALLYGSPPGYIGYKEGGILVNKIRQKPYSVVLFDEIEKAHPSVFDIFLQILDEGMVHDKLDRKGDFSNAIVVFTSNIGSEWIMEQFNKGQTPSANDLRDIMQATKKFRPEFLGRRMTLIPFAPINEKVAHSILDIHLGNFIKLLAQQEIDLSLSKEAKEALVSAGFSPIYGARPLKDTIEDRLATAIANKIINNEIVKGDKVEVGWDKKKDDFTWIISKS